ncbi:MAG: nucleotidyl transferase AbiEii/AbiGii toxin family protein [Oscillospiraceae bacterium]|nr:nucleotidyl transferase AbiEii/AbiGii toxin family protein [Oscillospiraceae bacterium]
MMQFDRISLGRQAKELGFVRDTFEKVCRLADVLSFMESDNLLSKSLALKGGTAINLTVFDLPRLSVDIDLDYSRNVPREAMLQEREQINNRIQKYMVASGYVLSPKSKQYHALDSFVFEYINAGGMRDNLKIEINYMLRCHVFPTSRRAVKLPWSESELTVLSIDPMEIFSAKVVALFNRAAARDLYDIFNLQKYKLFDESQEELFKKCIIFYFAIASETVPEHFDFDKIERISAQKIRTDLVPVLRKAERFNLFEAQEQVEEYLKGILLPEGDLSFWTEFAKGKYKSELLFNDAEILARIGQHPMAVWKCSKKTQK